MAWVWQKESSEESSLPGPYFSDVNELRTLTWFAILSNALVIIGFGLMLGFVNYDYVSPNEVVTQSPSINNSGGFIAGITLLAIGAFASLVLGISTVSMRWSPALSDEKGFITAFGVVTMISAFVFLPMVMCVILLIRMPSNRMNSIKNTHVSPLFTMIVTKANSVNPGKFVVGYKFSSEELKHLPTGTEFTTVSYTEKK